MKKSPPYLAGSGWFPAYTLVSYLSRLKKKMAQEYTPIWGLWAIFLTYLQDYFVMRTITHCLSSFPRKTCCRRYFPILANIPLFSLHNLLGFFKPLSVGVSHAVVMDKARRWQSPTVNPTQQLPTFIPSCLATSVVVIWLVTLGLGIAVPTPLINIKLFRLCQSIESHGEPVFRGIQNSGSNNPSSCWV